MKENEKIKYLKEDYSNIDIPDRLDSVVNEAFNNNKSKKRIYRSIIGTAASLVVFIGGVNVSPTVANALEKVPVLGSLVKVVNFSNYRLNENGFDISIDVPNIVGLEDKKLEDKINKEIDQEAKSLYNSYVKEMKELKEMNVEGHDLVQSWYEIKTDNNDVLSLIVYYHHAQGSSNTTRKCYNIDKKNETALTLKSMFKNEDYVKIISDNIKEQMRQQMKENPDKVYWIDSEMPDMNFKEIKLDQQFYINEKNELVICFDKYDAGPGYMGIVDFVIPKDVIQPLKNI